MTGARGKPLLTFWGVVATVLRELRQLRHTIREPHTCLVTDASTPPSCVLSGMSADRCNGRTAR